MYCESFVNGDAQVRLKTRGELLGGSKVYGAFTTQRENIISLEMHEKRKASSLRFNAAGLHSTSSQLKSEWLATKDHLMTEPRGARALEEVVHTPKAI